MRTSATPTWVRRTTLAARALCWTVFAGLVLLGLVALPFGGVITLGIAVVWLVPAIALSSRRTPLWLSGILAVVVAVASTALALHAVSEEVNAPSWEHNPARVWIGVISAVLTGLVAVLSLPAAASPLWRRGEVG